MVRSLAEAIAPKAISEQQRSAMRERVLASTLDTQPSDTETVRAEEVPWHEQWPGVWVRVLKRDVAADLQIALIRVEPGGRVPGHTHRKDEECLVLEGEILIGTHRLGAGDLHIARAGGHHPEVSSPCGALVMLRAEVPDYQAA